MGGCLFFQGNYNAISCNHVLAHNQNGATIYQPSLQHFKKNILGNVSGHYPFKKIESDSKSLEGSENIYDIAWFSTKPEVCHKNIIDIGPPEGFREPIEGEKVLIRGGMTQLTIECEIISTSAKYQRKESATTYSNWINGIVLEANCEGGDSGALLIAKKDRMIVGILSAGPEYLLNGNQMYATPIPQDLDKKINNV